METEEKVNQEEGNADEFGKRIRGLENQLVEKDMVLSQANSRVAEGEAVKARLDAEVAALKEQNTTVSGNLAALKSSLTESVKSYRELVLKSNPDVPSELIIGETVTAVSESLEKAKGLVSKVRENIETVKSLTRIPAGAPARTAASNPALTPHEKITHGIK